jgi:hypothetical protein
MVEERYIQMAISIRRTYLKLSNNLNLYGSRAAQVAQRLEETLPKIEEIQRQLDNRNVKVDEKEVLNKLLKIVDEVEEEGKRLENLVNPVNKEIEKLAKEEQELYRQIVEHHPNLKEEQIVSIIRDRLIKEGLS